MNTLDTLTLASTPVNQADIAIVDGGLLPLIVVLAGFDIGLWGYIAYTR